MDILTLSFNARLFGQINIIGRIKKLLINSRGFVVGRQLCCHYHLNYIILEYIKISVITYYSHYKQTISIFHYWIEPLDRNKSVCLMPQQSNRTIVTKSIASPSVKYASRHHHQSKYWHFCTSIFRKEPVQKEFFLNYFLMSTVFFLVMLAKMRRRFRSINFLPSASSSYWVSDRDGPLAPFGPFKSQSILLTSMLSKSPSSSEAAEKLYSWLFSSFFGEGDSEFVIVDCCKESVPSPTNALLSEMLGFA